VASRAARRSRRFTKGGPGIAGACEPAAFLLIAFLVFPAAASAAPNWTEADKDGYGTSTTTASKVWHTLDDGRLTEVFYPDLGTPSVRSLEFVVSQGAFSQRDSQAQNRSVQLIDSRSLTYRQVNEEPGRYRLTKTYVTDPARSVLMVDVRLESLTGKKLGLDLVYDPGLGNDYQDDVAEPDDDALLARDTGSPVASAVLGAPAFEDTSSQTTAGDLVQTAHTALTGLPGSQRLTVALGFGETTGAAQDAATASLGAGFGDVRGAYQSGWHDYIGSLKPAPKSADRTLYHASVMTLAAHEDKTYRGGYIASPTTLGLGHRPRESLRGIPPRLVARPVPDRHRADRRWRYGRRKPRDRLPLPQAAEAGRLLPAELHGRRHAALDQPPARRGRASDRPRLAARPDRQRPVHEPHQEGRRFIVNFQGLRHSPWSPQERWENQSGYSPGTIASEIAGLVCAADIARKNGDTASAQLYEDTADEWQSQVDGWTATTTGPYAPKPYYLRLTKDGDPDSSMAYNIGDSGPTVDQRKVVDPSFLELVRLGVKRADDPTIKNTLSVVDQQLASGDANGRYFWHRFNFDGYGEKKDGSPWDIGFPPNPTEVWANNITIGRNWPIFGGERGEYELLTGNSAAARTRLANIASAANDGQMLPEQVWAPDFPPAGSAGFPLGEGTFSATPLAWSHAQYVRLAWSIDAGRPVEQPSIVATRYGG
jgi:glucoamylase